MKKRFTEKAKSLPRSTYNVNLAIVLLLATVVFGVTPWAKSMETKAAQHATAFASSAVTAADTADGEPFIDKMVTAAEGLDNYSSSYEMVVYKEHPPINELGVFSFKKPRLMKVEVEKGPKKGSVAILALDGKVHGHLGGALKFFRASVSPDSELVRAANGFPMVGTDFYSLAAYLKNMLKEGDRSRVSREPIQTTRTTSPTYIVDMYASKFGNEPLLKRIYVDPRTYLPVFWEDYIDGKLWSESAWHNLKTNVEFAENFFKP